LFVVPVEIREANHEAIKRKKMGIIAIACYKPNKGKKDILKKIIKNHSKILLKENLLTKRPPIILDTKNGIIIEIFEWKSDISKAKAHKNIKILKHWDKIEKNSKSVRLSEIQEAKDIYANFQPIN